MQNVICHQKYFYLWYERGNVKFYFPEKVALTLTCLAHYDWYASGFN